MKLYSIQFGGDRRESECTMKEVLKGKVVEHYDELRGNWSIAMGLLAMQL